MKLSQNDVKCVNFMDKVQDSVMLKEAILIDV